MEHGIGKWWWVPALVAVVGVLIIVSIYTSHITQITHGGHLFDPKMMRCLSKGGPGC